MSLPASIREAVDIALEERGSRPIDRVSRVGGGCINNGARIDTAGDAFFLKWNATAPEGLFAAETDGLVALREALQDQDATHGLMVPEPIASGVADAGAWLLMEYIPQAPPEADSDDRLGRALAGLHGSPSPDARFGWHRDNWIGSLPQANDESSSWADFWRDERIGPQLEMARTSGHLLDDSMDHLLEIIPRALSDGRAPALLHGDLWSGNAYTTTGGHPVIIDPAVYRGDAEVDLAMTELFGGFGRRFYEAYDDVRPISASYDAYGRALYQLYYLLVHVNLFGQSYVAGSRAAADRVLAALGG